jgi:hypothetical protein
MHFLSSIESFYKQLRSVQVPSSNANCSKHSLQMVTLLAFNTLHNYEAILKSHLFSALRVN